MTERRDGDLRPRSAIDATNRGADIGVCVRGVEGDDWRRSDQRALDVPGRVMSEDEAVNAPTLFGDADAAKERQRVAGAGEACACHAVLLARELEHTTVTRSLSVVAAVDVRVFVSGCHIDACVRVGVLNSPGPHVDAELAGGALDAQMFERPQLHR